MRGQNISTWRPSTLGHGMETYWQGVAIRLGVSGQQGRSSGRRQVLQAEPSGRRPRREIHVGGGLRFADPLHAADRAALPEQEQQTGQTDHERRWVN